ncbi:zinc finger protein 260-like isoform X5 [Phlebotomus argentipes]|uniref:zinc finger protein 260-like isoform X5 n=1 Tax=Phlebotomus argentipes TaxID=94469 RepID=UPI002892AE85|nr:zinc finger protein 260-like isoform X5 [Phlebotomus argentipes]
MPVPPTSDLLATITMFEQQIKAEPMGFYSTCPPPPQMGQPLPPRSVEQGNEQTVITMQDDKDNNSMQPQSLIVPQPPDTPMSNVSDVAKPELSQSSSHGMPHAMSGQSNASAGTHTSRSKPQACKVCGKMLSSASSYYVHMKLHSGTKPFQCTVCEAAFCRKPYLEVHMRTHTGERPFQCDLCMKRFSQKSSLNTHKRIHTVQLKPYECQQCPAKFSRKPYLDIHYRTHTGERPFECEVCLKRFSQKSSLNIHKTIHTVQGRPFQCTECPAAFCRKPYLDIHVRIHTGEKPFLCDICLKRFTQKSSLNIHKRIHTGERPYACDICNKTFAVKSYVTAHRWSHVSEKPLSCDRCSMTFTSKAQFAIHIRTHSAGQNYECNICGRTFIRDSYLIRHHNRVHRENRTTANSIATINSVAAGHVDDGQSSGNVDFDSNNSQVCDLRYVSELQLNASPAVSQMSSPGIPADRVMMNDRSSAMTVLNGAPPNDRHSNGSSNGSAGPMDHSIQQERAAIQSRVLQERALQERAIQERVMQERAMQERVNMHAPISMSGHVMAHDATRIDKNVMPGTIASPGPV